VLAILLTSLSCLAVSYTSIHLFEPYPITLCVYTLKCHAVCYFGSIHFSREKYSLTCLCCTTLESGNHLRHCYGQNSTVFFDLLFLPCVPVRDSRSEIYLYITGYTRRPSTPFPPLLHRSSIDYTVCVRCFGDFFGPLFPSTSIPHLLFDIGCCILLLNHR
jgi:hypothetical protein